jgi:hypothetical protein
VKAWATFVAIAVIAPAGSAQVGYPPMQSPFRDLEYRQEFTLYSGYYAASDDPVGVAPRSGPTLGARYELRVGGPAQLSVRFARVWSERTVIDPTLAPAERVVAEEDVGLYLADAGFSFNLTGQKSWRGLVPVLAAGFGIATDFHGSRDVGGFRVGTPFAISAGGGVRWLPDGPYQLRVDVLNYWYQIQYPDSYFAGTPTNPAVRTGAQNVWIRNLSLTLGASYQFFR